MLYKCTFYHTCNYHQECNTKSYIQYCDHAVLAEFIEKNHFSVYGVTFTLHLCSQKANVGHYNGICSEN